MMKAEAAWTARRGQAYHTIAVAMRAEITKGQT
jgi:hypothetical protein